MADQFQSFLYNKHTVDQPLEEEWDVEDGLLHSPLYLWVCHSILLSHFELVFKFAVLQMYFHGEQILVTFGEENEVCSQ